MQRLQLTCTAAYHLPTECSFASLITASSIKSPSSFFCLLPSKYHRALFAGLPPLHFHDPWVLSGFLPTAILVGASHLSHSYDVSCPPQQHHHQSVACASFIVWASPLRLGWLSSEPQESASLHLSSWLQEYTSRPGALSLSPSLVSSRDQTQVLVLARSALYPLSHLSPAYLK